MYYDFSSSNRRATKRCSLQSAVSTMMADGDRCQTRGKVSLVDRDSLEGGRGQPERRLRSSRGKRQSKTAAPQAQLGTTFRSGVEFVCDAERCGEGSVHFDLCLTPGMLVELDYGRSRG